MPQEYKLVLKYADQPDYTPDIDCYLRHGGYEVLKKALAIQPKTLSDGQNTDCTGTNPPGSDDLRPAGRGGAGFSCGLK